jgi:UDP-N-acetylmuramyl pentapeptide phosphotransferase/UDP-N-acetylglucosamine-1-phosphate transferase|tara:strand:- start:9644 stop:9859 length:216 start_codon:yes stop_codon:yes gene_type:complete
MFALVPFLLSSLKGCMMPILLIVLVALLIGAIGFWDALGALLGAVALLALFWALVAITAVIAVLWLIRKVF